jgi:hypothetical protein
MMISIDRRLGMWLVIQSIEKAKSEKLSEWQRRIEAALDAATESGLRAAAEFTASAPCTADGHIADTCGWAYVMVSHPTYHFREALKLMNPGAHGLRSQWIVLSFSLEGMAKGASQSITAHEVACKAGVMALEREFPELSFYVRSRVD